jgi:hypothetical protein
MFDQLGSNIMGLNEPQQYLECFDTSEFQLGHAPLGLVCPAYGFAAPQSVASLCSQSWCHGFVSQLRSW